MLKRVMAAVASGNHCGRLALAAEPATQQNKMTVRNEEAGKKQFKGGERKKFMSECLSTRK